MDIYQSVWQLILIHVGPWKTFTTEGIIRPRVQHNGPSNRIRVRTDWIRNKVEDIFIKVWTTMDEHAIINQLKQLANSRGHTVIRTMTAT